MRMGLIRKDVGKDTMRGDVQIDEDDEDEGGASMRIGKEEREGLYEGQHALHTPGKALWKGCSDCIPPRE